MKIKNLCTAAILGLVTTLTATSASAIINVTIGGTSVADEGIVSSVAGAITTNFNGSFANPAGYFGGGVVNGNSAPSGQYASPPNDTSNYFSVGPSTIEAAIINTGLASYFGYYGGSPDDYNNVSFFNSATESLIATFTGTQLATFAGVEPNGDQSVGFFWNFTASDSVSYFDTVVFDSIDYNAFETDNHAVLAAAVPEPETYAMMLIGMGMIGFTARRRKSD